MIGIDISDRSIKIAEVTGRKQQVVRTVCWSALPASVMRRGVIQDVTKVSDLLREAMIKCSPVPLQGKTVVGSIPEVQSFVRVLELPVMSMGEMEEAVQWAVRQHIPFDLERVYLDWQLLDEVPSRPKYKQVLIGAAQRDVVDPLLRVLDIAGLTVVALELETQAIVRSVLPHDSQGISGVLIIDLGATSTNVIFFDEGAMRFTTNVQMGGDDLTQQLANQLQLESKEAAEKKALVGVSSQASDQQVASSLRIATMQLVQRVGQVVREITSQFQNSRTIRTILLSGGSANLPGIIEVFSEVFPGIPIQLGNPWTNIAVDSEKNVTLSAADAAHFVTAIGSAQREAHNAG